jgi:uncharacterized protein (DUF3820 family)
MTRTYRVMGGGSGGELELRTEVPAGNSAATVLSGRHGQWESTKFQLTEFGFDLAFYGDIELDEILSFFAAIAAARGVPRNSITGFTEGDAPPFPPEPRRQRHPIPGVSPPQSRAQQEALPVTLERALAFVMPFGKHKDKPLGELPPGYLMWVAENLQNDKIRALAQLIVDSRKAQSDQSESKRVTEIEIPF